MRGWQVSSEVSCAREVVGVVKLVTKAEMKDVCWQSELSCRWLAGWSRVGGALLEGGRSELRRRGCFARCFALNGEWDMARRCRAMDRAWA